MTYPLGWYDLDSGPRHADEVMAAHVSLPTRAQAVASGVTPASGSGNDVADPLGSVLP